jgi:hypothetical protein
LLLVWKLLLVWRLLLVWKLLLVWRLLLVWWRGSAPRGLESRHQTAEAKFPYL